MRNLFTRWTAWFTEWWVKPSTRKWRRGVAGALIGGGANGVVVTFVKPEDFNIVTWEGFLNLTMVMIGSGVIGAFQWLREHPLPEDE